MPDTNLLALRFLEGDRLACDGAYRSRATTQAWVAAVAMRSTVRALEVHARLCAHPGGAQAARKFRRLCARDAEARLRAGCGPGRTAAGSRTESGPTPS